METTTFINLLGIFSQAYPNQVSKMTIEDRDTFINTWMMSFGKFPDNLITEAAMIAIKKSPFIPSLSEFSAYIRKAELLQQARAIDEAHAYKLNKDMSDPQKAAEVEQFLLWVGDKPENASATAWAGVERRKIGGTGNETS